MSNEELIEQGERLIKQIDDAINTGIPLNFAASRIEGVQFLRDYAGEDSIFYKEVSGINFDSKNPGYMSNLAKVSIQSFLRYLKNGLVGGVSPLRQAQIEVVGDFLEQANYLLRDNKVHPAAPAVLIGAALEEFLRNWAESISLTLESNKASIDAYAKLLREKELITKQEKKDIDAWAGNRNNAAHGIWHEIDNRQLVNIMLQGVNLFISRHSAQ